MNISAKSWQKKDQLLTNDYFMPILKPRTHELIFKDEVYAIIGAAMEVHNELGYGFLEAVLFKRIIHELH